MSQKKEEKKKIKIPPFIEQDPVLKKKFEEYMAKVSPEKVEEDFQKFQKFIEGEMTWAEIKGFPRHLLKDLAKIAYLKYQRGDYKVAETLFKGLSIIDHNNWYYRAALGAIYQKQKIYEQAIEEYNTALLLNEKEITSFTNRGECYLHLHNYNQALQDFDQAIALDPEDKNAWAKRARILKNNLMRDGHGGEVKGNKKDS